MPLIVPYKTLTDEQLESIRNNTFPDNLSWTQFRFKIEMLKKFVAALENNTRLINTVKHALHCNAEHKEKHSGLLEKLQYIYTRNCNIQDTQQHILDQQQPFRCSKL